MLHNVTIIQKYHTQMGVDSMHALIERKLKHQTINVPAEYINICRKARNSKPYQVKYLNYGYFKNFQNQSFYKSIRPGKIIGDPKVTDKVSQVRFFWKYFITNSDFLTNIHC